MEGRPVPVHDWTRVRSGLWHSFHQSWTVRIAETLNGGVLPRGTYALVEQRMGGPEPDVIAVQSKSKPAPGGGTSTLSDAVAYAGKANRISIRHPFGHVVAVIEVVSPGNKDSKTAFRSFVTKAVDLLRGGVHLLVIDLFPPSDRDPQGVHAAIWDEVASDAFELPPGLPLTLVSYQVGDETVAHIEPIAVGDRLPDMPLFLTPHEHVPVPLDATYQATWAVAPEPIRDATA